MSHKVIIRSLICLGPVYTERQSRRCDNSPIMLAILFYLGRVNGNFEMR